MTHIHAVWEPQPWAGGDRPLVLRLSIMHSVNTAYFGQLKRFPNAALQVNLSGKVFLLLHPEEPLRQCWVS